MKKIIIAIGGPGVYIGLDEEAVDRLGHWATIVDESDLSDPLEMLSVLLQGFRQDESLLTQEHPAITSIASALSEYSEDSQIDLKQLLEAEFASDANKDIEQHLPTALALIHALSKQGLEVDEDNLYMVHAMERVYIPIVRFSTDCHTPTSLREEKPHLRFNNGASITSAKDVRRRRKT